MIGLPHLERYWWLLWAGGVWCWCACVHVLSCSPLSELLGNNIQCISILLCNSNQIKSSLQAFLSCTTITNNMHGGLFSKYAMVLVSSLSSVEAMTGMGFNDLNGWPSSGIDHVRIWDRYICCINPSRLLFLWFTFLYAVIVLVAMLGVKYTSASIRYDKSSPPSNVNNSCNALLCFFINTPFFTSVVRLEWARCRSSPNSGRLSWIWSNLHSWGLPIVACKISR